MAKIVKSEVLGPEHPIYGGEWTVSSHRKRTPEEDAKYVEFMNTHKKHVFMHTHKKYAIMNFHRK